MAGLIKDLTTLDVITITGNLHFAVRGVEFEDDGTEGRRRRSRGSVINFEELLNSVRGTTTEDSKLRVIAASRIEIDKDTHHFVSDNLQEQDLPLVQLHFHSVTAAEQARAALAGRLKEAIFGGE